MKAGG